MKKTLLPLLFVVFASACIQSTSSTSPEPNTIEITSAGFNPDFLEVESGTTVTFINKDTAPHWPASAVHPTHTVYPEYDGCISSKFDACKGLQNGESWSFTFTQLGTWKYHDHLNPSFTGKITVK
ncbi:MAG TPA: cupredoxin domain-containing protein [archaeon]|nr:cupredoxin domain-containing protein [archaeon]